MPTFQQFAIKTPVEMLSDAESDAGSIHQLTINEHYAKAFSYRKEREELQKRPFKFASRAPTQN